MQTTRHAYTICLNCFGNLDSRRVCLACGKKSDDSPSPPYALPVRTILNGRFLIGRVLGKGGFGITYLAWDMDKMLKVAIKEYYPDAYGVRLAGEIIVAAKNRELQSNFERWKDLFVGEAIALFKLRDLPGIVSVKEYFPLNNTAYIVMEFLEGVTLSKYLDMHHGALPIKHALSLIKPVMLSLINIHQRGMLHRDISPDNIIIVQNKFIKLIDFGGAKRDMFDPSNTLVTLKPGYSPIEQYYNDRKQGTFTDVYALAATLYRAITGRVPPDALSRSRVESLLLPTRLGVSLAPIQEQAVLKALNLQPQDRYHTVGDFLNALYGPGATSKLNPEKGIIMSAKSTEKTLPHIPGQSGSLQTGYVPQAAAPMPQMQMLTPQQLQQMQSDIGRVQKEHQATMRSMTTMRLSPQQMQQMQMQLQMQMQQMQQLQQMQQMQMQMQQMQHQMQQQMGQTRTMLSHQQRTMHYPKR